MSLSYNFLKIYHKSIFVNTGLPDHVKILHYVVKKPWQQREPVPLEVGTLWQERYWFDYYSEVLRLKSHYFSNEISEEDIISNNIRETLDNNYDNDPVQ